MGGRYERRRRLGASEPAVVVPFSVSPFWSRHNKTHLQHTIYAEHNINSPKHTVSAKCVNNLQNQCNGSRFWVRGTGSRLGETWGNINKTITAVAGMVWPKCWTGRIVLDCIVGTCCRGELILTHWCHFGIQKANIFLIIFLKIGKNYIANKRLHSFLVVGIKMRSCLWKSKGLQCGNRVILLIIKYGLVYTIKMFLFGK